MTLQELMARAAQDPRSRYGSQPSSGGGPDLTQRLGLDPSIAAQIDAATQPEPTVDEPVPGKSKLWAKILSAIADSGSAYGSALAGGPRTDFSGRMAENDRSIPKIMAGNEARRKDATAKAKSRREELKLQALMSQQIREDNRIGRQQLQDDAQAARKAIADQTNAQNVAAQALRTQGAKDKMDLEVKLEKMRGGFQESVARINGNVDKTQARMDKKDLGEALTFIGKTALSAKAMLAGGNGQPPMTPEQIMKTVDITLDGLTLTPEARKAADAYAAKELGVILHNHSIEQMNTEMAGNGPQQDTSFNLTKWMREHGY